MSELALMNKDIVHETTNLPTQRTLDLNKEVIECRACRRLVEYRESVARVKKKGFQSWNYWGRPVPGFGDIAASIFVIGLAPAPHGGIGQEECSLGIGVPTSSLRRFSNQDSQTS